MRKDVLILTISTKMYAIAKFLAALNITEKVLKHRSKQNKVCVWKKNIKTSNRSHRFNGKSFWNRAEPIFVSPVINEMILQPVQIFFHICFRADKCVTEKSGNEKHPATFPEKIYPIWEKGKFLCSRNYAKSQVIRRVPYFCLRKKLFQIFRGEFFRRKKIRVGEHSFYYVVKPSVLNLVSARARRFLTFFFLSLIHVQVYR